MNKATKGALAAAAAAAILAGGAGTMAAWTSNSTTGGGTISAGALNITQVGQSGVWTWVGGTKDGAPFNAGSDRLVPGDTVRYTATYKITAVGTNLTATLTPSVGNVSGGLSSYLVATPAAGQPTTVTEADNDTNITVSSDITFKGDTTNKDGQGLTADLANATVTLQQN